MNACYPGKCSFRRLQPALRSLSALVLLQFIPGQAFAVNRTWDGRDSVDFETPANWSVLPSNNLTSDIATFSGAVTAYQPQLSTSRSINGLLFSTPAGGWTLGSGSAAHVLTLGGNGISTAGQTSGTNTLAANLSLGAAQTWAAGTGGTLLITGSITSTSGFPLTVNNAGNLGSVILSPAAGNNVSLTGASNSNFFLLARSGGVLMLGGDGVSAPATVSVNTIVNSSTGSTYGAMTITGGGAMRVNSGTWNLGDLAQANGGNSIGTAISTKVFQSGGIFSNGITPGGGTNGGTATSFTIGHSGMTSTGSGATLSFTPVSNILVSYTLSGGTLLRGCLKNI